MPYQTISMLSKKLLEGSLSAFDLTNEHFQRIDSLNNQLNAIVIDNRTAARARAIDLDHKLNKGSATGPLHGIPITVKEAINIKGLKTTVNFPPLKNNIAQENSILVERLLDAGAIILGKTNVPLLLSDAQTFGPLYPRCNNPYDLTRTPGGSTGGGAAAVAAGISLFEIGSDIGGSIRNPSHYCGLFGLKPTQNSHAQDGHVPPMPNIDLGFSALASTGPIARTVDDLKIAYDVAYRPRWDYLQYLPINNPTPNYDSLKDYKIGWFDQIGPHTVSQETQSVLSSAVKTLKEQGACVERITLDSQWAAQIYNIWATLFGFVVGQDFNWFMRQALKLKFRYNTKGSLNNTYKALNRGLSLNFVAYSKVLRQQQETTAEFSRWFEHYDFILSPTSVGPAFKHNPKHKPIMVDGVKTHYVDYCFSFVMPFNAMGNPVLVVPGQQDANKLPIGIQCIGQHNAEPQLLHFGKLMEEAGFYFRPPKL
ncbi:MAG: amidase [Oleiphilaceae bacterium]|jgi:amidase